MVKVTFDLEFLGVTMRFIKEGRSKQEAIQRVCLGIIAQHPLAESYPSVNVLSIEKV